MTVPEAKERAQIFQASALYKLLSGRFILTVAGAWCFSRLCVTLCRMLESKAEVMTIGDITPLATNILLVLSNIFTFYFMKSTLDKKGNGDF